MRDNVRAFVQIAAQSWGLRGPVYEFGSYQVENQNGLGNLRPFFQGERYIGCDMRPGPGVDRIEDLARLKLPNDTAQTIICVDTLEHVFEVRRAVDEMLRVLAPGGMILLVAPLDFHVHDYPSDYWRLTPSCMTRLLSGLEATLIGWQGVEDHPHTVFGIGAKAPISPQFAAAGHQFIDRMQAWLRASQEAQPWQRKLKQRLVAPLRSKGERRRQREFFHAEFALHLPCDPNWRQRLLPSRRASEPAR